MPQKYLDILNFEHLSSNSVTNISTRNIDINETSERVGMTSTYPISTEEYGINHIHKQICVRKRVLKVTSQIDKMDLYFRVVMLATL